MKMAKADEDDLKAALDLCGAMEDLIRGYLPSAMTPEDDESPTWFDESDSARVIEHLVGIAKRGSLFRVVFGMDVLLDPRNEVVDPDADVLEMHPKHVKAAEQRDELLAALERLTFAAQCRDNTMGDPCRLIEVKAELFAAAEQGRAAIAKAKGGA